MIGVGGISNAEQAYAKICAGASAVQFYTALVYGGISLAQKSRRAWMNCWHETGSTLSRKPLEANERIGCDRILAQPALFEIPRRSGAAGRERRADRVRKYLEDAPSADEIRAVLDRLGIDAIDMMRTGEKRFKELGLTKNTPADDLIAAMAENPILIERPLAISGDKAAIGRPPENLLALL